MNFFLTYLFKPITEKFGPICSLKFDYINFTNNINSGFSFFFTEMNGYFL